MTVRKIFGPPGTGKTRRLMELVEEEVRAGTPLERIAYLSFSRSAAEVIRERMNASDEDVRWFRTIHGACVKVLGLSGAIIDWSDYRKFSQATGMKISPRELDEDMEGAYNVTMHAYNLSLAKQEPLDDVLRSLSYNVNLSKGRVNFFIEKWLAYKKEVRKFDFMDMLTEFVDHGSALPCDVIFLDEAQDLSVLQWKVFEIMAANAKRVYMAGDDDQAIYGFIGGSEFGFLDRPCDEEELLTKSWRVPNDIGLIADRVISRVSHRKHKEVIWREGDGDVMRLSLEATTLPWRNWLERYESIMVLCRHRGLARKFSDDLHTIHVGHALHGESPSSWKEARFVRTFEKLRSGMTVTPKQAGDLLLAFGRRDQSMRERNRRDRISADMLEINFEARDWPIIMGRGDVTKTRKYEILRRIVDDGGEKALDNEAKINISTMHAAKGKEADLVIILPECNATVRNNLRSATETRLAYVALTRAKKQVALLLPRSDSYMTHFFGG